MAVMAAAPSPLSPRVVPATVVMMPVVVRPPERAALHRRRAPEREEELAAARGVIRLVGKIPVIDAGDGEHPDEVQDHRGPDREGAPTHPNYSETRDVQDDKRNAPHPIHPIRLGPHLGLALGAMVGIDPLENHGGTAAEE